MIYPTQADIIYLAGIVDGEGSINISTRPSGYQLSLSVSNTAESLIRWLEDRFAGYTRPYGIRPRRRPCWRWTITGDAAASLLKRLQYHLLIKSYQARLAMEYWAQRGDYTGRTLPPDEIERREGFRLALLASRKGEAA